jgi:hypothetical protein
MVERLKNWITTSIGVIIMLFGGVMIFFKAKCYFTGSNCTFTVREICEVFVIGYTFLMARDSLLEGITLGLFKKAQ